LRVDAVTTVAGDVTMSIAMLPFVLFVAFPASCFAP
jgi:hypothetical protein